MWNRRCWQNQCNASCCLLSTYYVPSVFLDGVNGYAQLLRKPEYAAPCFKPSSGSLKPLI